MIWKIIASMRSFWDKCVKDNISAFAAQSAFFIIMSMIPFLMLITGLIRYTPASEAMLMESINNFMPPYVAPFVMSILDEVYNRSVGIVSIAGVAALWSAAKGIQYLSKGLNVVNGITEQRNWLILRFQAIIDTVIFIAVIMILLVLMVFGNSLQKMLTKYVPVISRITRVFIERRVTIVFALLIVLMLILYMALPDRKVTIKSQLPGAFLSTCALYLFSFLLSIYVDYFNGFSMYGSLTTITLVMLWLYFCMYIILICAEINYVFNSFFKAMHTRFLLKIDK